MDKPDNLPQFHPKLMECLKLPKHGTVLSGAFCTEAVDTVGEQISIKDMDISSLNDGSGLANSEHINPRDEEKLSKEDQKSKKNVWAVIVGRVIFAKKIFKKEDCESQKELELWDEIGLPFVFGGIELFDSEGHSGAQDLASMVRHYHDRGLPVVARYSIEGSVVSREGNILKPTIARKVAVTVKPCNHSAISSLVATSNLAKKEGEISFSESVSFPMVEIDPIETLIDGLDVLRKTWTGGGADAAPTSLSQAGATASEYIVGGRRKEDILKNKQIKYTLLAAVRDWNKATDLKKYLKNRLKELDDKIIDKFADAIEEFIVPKGLIKAEKEYAGKMVTPGEIRIIAGPLSGTKLRSLYEDNDSVHVEALKSGGTEGVKINKIPKSKEGVLWVKIKNHEISTKPIKAKGQTHKLNQSFEQTALIHNLRLDTPVHKRNFASESSQVNKIFGWFAGESGQKVLVKPEVVSSWDQGKEVPSTYREVMFYNLAKHFFNLKRFVPVTAMLKHPDTDEEYSGMEEVKDSEHYVDHQSNLSGKKTLKTAGESGGLDKLAIMDSVLGMGDRHRLNYMLAKDGVMLVDNASLFNWKPKSIPSYLLDFAKEVGGIEQLQIHNDTKQWLISLDPFVLKEELLKMEVPEELSNECAKRLMSMQSSVIDGNASILSILFAHDKLPNEHIPVDYDDVPPGQDN